MLRVAELTDGSGAGLSVAPSPALTEVDGLLSTDSYSNSWPQVEGLELWTDKNQVELTC